MSVETYRHNHILVIKMMRPEKRNALNTAITQGIDAGMNELEDDPDLWCGILTGTESVFSAGADLVEGPGVPTERGGMVGIISRKRTKPLIGAVEGLALGGGVELLLCCDLIVAASNATFGLPEVKRGLMPDFGGAFRISRYLPINIAREMMLTGKKLTADHAERLGFVNEVAEPGKALSGALKMAERICENSPPAVREALGIFNTEVNGDESAIWKLSNEAHARLLETEDFLEGWSAFVQKRNPVWKGK